MPDERRMDDEFRHDGPLSIDDLRQSMGFEGFQVQRNLQTGDQRTLDVVARARHERTFAAAAVYADLNAAIGRAVVAGDEATRALHGYVFVFDDTPLLPTEPVSDAEHAASMQRLLDMLLGVTWEEEAMRWAPDRGAEEIEAWEQLLSERRSR